MADKRALVVEDDETWQEIHSKSLERVLGPGNVDVVDSYDSAVALMATNQYDVYVLDGEFPRQSGDPEELGIPLAREIAEREGSFDKVRLVSGKTHILDKAQELGIITYTKGKGNADEGYLDFSDLNEDIMDMLGL